MDKRETIRCVVEGKKPAYVPWSMGFTHDSWKKLCDHYGEDSLDNVLQDHLLWVNSASFEDLPNKRVRDEFHVIWNRSVDSDIGVAESLLLPEPTMGNYQFPNPTAETVFEPVQEKILRAPDRYRIFGIGFSLFERAWTLRGMENLFTDFYANPDFVRELLNAIGDFNIARVRRALEFDIDAVYFGDDWGSQLGLLMGYPIWREFIYPVIKRMYGVVRAAGKAVFIHSCGKVDELFDDLVEAGLSCFNPFQPEVMDVEPLMARYRGKLAFHGGLSTQRLLPLGTPQEVRIETRKLLEIGINGGYIFAPAHAVKGDVPIENMVAMIEEVTCKRN
jgi:uroporphyrinogen decarboxylase